MYNPFMYQQPQQQQSGIIWVQGVAGAQAYPIAAGSSLLLMDSEDSVFYIKTTDASGMPAPLRVFDYKERTSQPESNYVTKEYLDQRLAEMEAKHEPTL